MNLNQSSMQDCSSWLSDEAIYLNHGTGSQAYLRDQSSAELSEEFLREVKKGGKGQSISQLAKLGILNKNSDLYRQKCAQSTFYPFSIALE